MPIYRRHKNFSPKIIINMIHYLLTILLGLIAAHIPHHYHVLKMPRPLEQAEKVTDRPIIGILTCEFDIMNNGIPIESFPSTYTNMVETTGARAVPISYRLPKDELYALLDKVNGVVFTGGDIEQFDKLRNKYHEYFEAAKLVTEYVIEKNKRGDYFPLFAICQGFQTLHMFIANDPYVMNDSRRWGFNDTMIPTGIPFNKTRFFSKQYEDLYSVFEGSEVEFNWHKYGIYLSQYEKYPSLRNFFRILSYDEVPDSPPIVAAVEAYDYPIYAVQYHPEKNLFDFLHPSIPHSRRAQQHTEDMAFFFVSE